jgi:HAD superfamily hydrolase (TIGR01509 family)
MKIKAVLLDFGGTLADGALEWKPYHESIRSFLASHGYNTSMKDLKKELRRALGELEKIRAKGLEMTFEEVYSIFLGNLGVRYDDDMLEYLHENFRNHYKTNFYTCTESILMELSVKYKVALVSNTMSDQPKRLLSESGLEKFFDVIYCSRDLGVRKPNPEIFNIVLKELGVHPEETVHVGDRIEADMYGAERSNITGIWIKTPNQPPWSGYAISSICELTRFLDILEDEDSS